MNQPTAKQLERLPSKGAKAALLTKKGIIAGVLVNWSEKGAVVVGSGEVLAGSQVCLRVQGPDKVWEKNATVLWVNKDQGFGLEFESNGLTQQNRVIPWIQQLLQSMVPRITNHRVAPQSLNRSAAGAGKPSAKRASAIGMQSFEKRVTDGDKRRRPRFRIATPAQVMWLDCAAVDPEITTITDASSAGVLFTTNRDYPVGTKLQVKYPFPSSISPEQQGDVVRVEILADGRRSVAVAFG